MHDRKSVNTIMVGQDRTQVVGMYRLIHKVYALGHILMAVRAQTCESGTGVLVTGRLQITGCGH